MKRFITVIVLSCALSSVNALTHGEHQERVARSELFGTILTAIGTIVAAPAVYLKKLTAIDDLPQATKDQYASNTTVYTSTFNKILNLSKKKIVDAKNTVDNEIKNHKP